ncbi:transport and Golgi organization protein 6 homolog [Bufo gargarizans]|uniref:transport and Golgi organization protein 6 homolog n=1 Tax=Bufo gargarizans TaxID=30331 RepID=UPI001CF5FC11|nr:transport and Golgi organization protein 6 homolog [Bufo gargarizans]
MAVSVNVGTVVEALKILITPRESGSTAHNTDKQAALLSTLQFNVSSLEEELKQVSKWGALVTLRERLSKDAPGFPESLQEDPSWKFTSVALLLLLCLKECMIELAKSFQPSKPNLRTPEAAPSLSPDTLSISQQKTVQSVLQFVVSMGICPYLLPGIGLPLQHRSEFGALVCSMVSCDLPQVRTRRLYIACMSLLEVSHHSSLGSLLFTQHLGDLMAGLCQLGYCPANQGTKESLKALSESERGQCKEALRGLLDQLYQPLVIRELLILQGGPRQGPRPSGAAASLQRAPAPAWLRRLSGQLLSERLMRPNGVQAVVRGILEDAGVGVAGGREAEAAASNWKKCDAVAKVLASCPQQSITVEEYYRKVCPQILDLLHIQNPLTARQFQRVATETFLKMGREQSQLAEKYLIMPMLKPLLYCTTTEADKAPDPGETLVSESALSQCIEDIVKVFVVGNDPTVAILNVSRQLLLVIFSLYCFARQNASHIRSACQDILLWFLEKSDRESAVSALAGLSGLESSLPSLPYYSYIKPGSEGGAVIAIREDRSEDDEDALYDRVTGEQWRLQCLADLLSINPHTGLAADFFLYCLKRLTPITAEEESPGLSPSTEDSLLDIERKLTLRYQSGEKKLQLLQVLSVLCERISDSIFTDVKQVVEFVLMTLERACTSLATSEGGTVASETLSMAMGLVAAMLGAVELTSADFEYLKQLIPVLEKVMESHPEPVIQELASDLRVTIATHCAVPLPNRTHNDSDTEKKDTRQQSLNKDADLQNIQEILSSARDPDVPTRAAALRFLTRLLEQRHPQLTEHREQVMQLYVENLEQEDPFVYLSAIQGIAVMSGDIPERILPILLAQYESAVPPKAKPPAPETRLKVGEALMRCTRTLGDMVLRHKDTLIHAFLRGCRDPDSSVRASSLSNLGELCKQLQFSLGPVIHEMTSCLSAVVHTDPEAQVRRAAIHVIVLLLRGLSERATEVLRDVLLELYRLLKFVVQCEKDSVSVLHAQLGLEELDSIMRALLFPPQKLEKKIMVLP